MKTSHTLAASPSHASSHSPRWALLSLYDKTLLLPFAQRLLALGFRLVSTGGTLQMLQAHGLEAQALSALTGHEEILEGRVKTLHPLVFAAILARPSAADAAQLARLNYPQFDLVAVNLYPFIETLQDPAVTDEALIEQIDIGGVSLLRAAAKNYARVTVCSAPQDYEEVLQALETQGEVPKTLRQELAVRALALTAYYDAAISQALSTRFEVPLSRQRHITTGYEQAYPLRYGENPHQAAAAYQDPLAPHSLLKAAQLQGKALSYNNLLDADAALRILRDLCTEPQNQPPQAHSNSEAAGLIWGGQMQGSPAVNTGDVLKYGEDLARTLTPQMTFQNRSCVIVKHNVPCGVASSHSLLAAYEQALSCDEKSAFGGIVALSHEVDEALARKLSEHFLEVIIAPALSPEARAILSAKKNLRLLELPHLMAMRPRPLEIRAVMGGALVQQADGAASANPYDWEVVSEAQPTPEDEALLRFAWAVCRHVKSNAIVIAQHAQGGGIKAVGISGGQTSRVDAVQIALAKAGPATWGAALASDGFFPFADSIALAAAQGIRSIIQPGGSMRDAEVIEASNKAKQIQIKTNRRHFKH